jgi:hypothetical protein
MRRDQGGESRWRSGEGGGKGRWEMPADELLGFPPSRLGTFSQLLQAPRSPHSDLLPEKKMLMIISVLRCGLDQSTVAGDGRELGRMVTQSVQLGNVISSSSSRSSRSSSNSSNSSLM